jgi:hypothetical protein
MFDNIAVTLYFVIGYVIVYIALETAWHFIACKIPDERIKPCMYKQVKLTRKKGMDSEKLRRVSVSRDG